MNNKSFVIIFLSVAVFAIGCKPSEKESNSQQLDQVKADTKAAARDLKDYTYSQKTEFAATMQKHLDGLNMELDTLSAKLEKADDGVKAEAKPKIQALRDRVTELNKQLESVRNASESTWDNVKATSQKALDSLTEGFQQSRQWLSDKIAP
jgi:ElaB/YqjD/DUF883 family membrane-anchored ribosome-binding protein